MSHASQKITSLRCAVVTVSDTRTPQTDRGGPIIVERLKAAGHIVVAHDIIPDELQPIRSHVESLLAQNVEAVILTGGTGIAPRDVTFEAVEPLLEKRLDGFGELFRMLSFQQIGPAAMLSRALAGTRQNCMIFALPGSPKAVELAMDQLLVPTLSHIANLLQP